MRLPHCLYMYGMCCSLLAGKNKKNIHLKINFDIYLLNTPPFFACHNNNTDFTLKSAFNVLNLDPTSMFIHVWDILNIIISDDLNKICPKDNDAPWLNCICDQLIFIPKWCSSVAKTFLQNQYSMSSITILSSLWLKISEIHHFLKNWQNPSHSKTICHGSTPFTTGLFLIPKQCLSVENLVVISNQNKHLMSLIWVIYSVKLPKLDIFTKFDKWENDVLLPPVCFLFLRHLMLQITILIMAIKKSNCLPGLRKISP